MTSFSLNLFTSQTRTETLPSVQTFFIVRNITLNITLNKAPSLHITAKLPEQDSEAIMYDIASASGIKHLSTIKTSFQDEVDSSREILPLRSRTLTYEGGSVIVLPNCLGLLNRMWRLSDFLSQWVVY